MSGYLKRVWAEVNLDNIAHNVREIRKLASQNVKILAVTKADAYGHGFMEVARTLLENGADALGVATLDEAKQLRNSDFSAPILILGYTPPECADDLVSYDIVQTVFCYPLAKAISDAAVKNKRSTKIHIKLDTGMNRVGFLCNAESVMTILEIAKLPMLQIEGIFTHFATADEADKRYTLFQYEKFITFINLLEKNGLQIPVKHCANSATTLNYPEMHMDMIRPGIILYGLKPSAETDSSKIDLRPAMELKANVTLVKKVPKGQSVSYGRIYKTTSDTLIATVPLGYADGYSRLLAKKAKMLVRGQYLPVIGTICMDQCMIDATVVNNITVGDEVVIFGRQGGNFISIEEIAKFMGTIHYELLCVIGKRVPRVYISGGNVVEVLNYLA